MPLLVYRFSEYEHTAEREQFRSLCKQLQSLYKNKEEICIFIGNYNIFDCELDAILIKADAIIGIEFKNYGGNITARENGQWTLDDGTIVKGGSRKSVYQQAKLNHIAIKRGFKEGGIFPSKILKDIAGLVVFHQNVNIDNQLSPRVQSWLHICDERTFMEKVQDITSKGTNLSLSDFSKLVVSLNLTEDYLISEYSVNPNKYFAKQDENLRVANESKLDETSNYNDEDAAQLSSFVSQIIKTLFRNETYTVRVLRYHSANQLFNEYGYKLSQELVVTIEGDNISSNKDKLERFVHHKITSVNKDLVFWEDGEIMVDPNESRLSESLISDKVRGTHTVLSYKRKMKTSLPHWLDLFLFEKLHAVYAPEHNRFEYNLNLTSEEVKVYLGTYFPRSYGELFCIADNLFQNPAIYGHLQHKKSLSILDFGCGTGGETLGVLTAISKYFPNIQEVNISAIDGNKSSLESLDSILSEACAHVKYVIKYSLLQNTIASVKDIDYSLKSQDEFDLILCCKMGCELKSRHIIDTAYSELSKHLTRHLNKQGLLILLDVTTKNLDSGNFYPQELNKEVNAYLQKHCEFKTLLPLSCSNNSMCQNLCFMQQSFEITHSHKRNDESRICYRIIGPSAYVLECTDSENIIGKHIISPIKYGNNKDEGFCPHSNGEIPIDTFNINQNNG